MEFCMHMLTARRARRGAIALAVVAALISPLLGPSGSATQLGVTEVGLPLGRSDLAETRTVEQVASGVTLTTIKRGNVSPADFWTVTAAFFPDRAAADSLAARLTAAGFAPRVEQVNGRAMDDPQEGPVGFQVRVGASHVQAEMTALATRLTAAGFAGGSVTSTALDGTAPNGPWVVRALRISPSALPGRLRAHLATDIVPGRETLSSMAGRLGAVAGVNGGYFVIDSSDGTPGDLAGISVVNGHLVSEAVNGRAAFILAPGSRAEVDRLVTRMTASSSDGAVRTLNGLNRALTHPNEIIAFDPAFGASADAGAGAQAVLDSQGRVQRLDDSRGGAIPPDGTVLEGIGTGADWLRAHARPGQTLTLARPVTDTDGHPLTLGNGLDVVNGGPMLVAGGQPFVDAWTEGFVKPDLPSYYYGFGVRRNPRTMAGVTATDDILLVTVDGRQPGYSVGLSVSEEAAVMRALGAQEALNLDGGGSTTMVAGGKLLGRPSDAAGERPLGDGLLVQTPTSP
jgi:Phosphodiester glycosidase/SPOR domain